jgi:hypothetical protein
VPVPQLHPTRKADLERQHRAIDKAQAVVERHLGRLERSLKSRKAATDWDRWDREFSDDVHKLVEDIVEAEGTLYAFKLGGSFDMRRVKNYLRAMAEGAAEGINDKVREEVDSLGLDAAMARKQAHVESAGAGLGSGAIRWSREEAARQSPDFEHRVKTWIPDTQRHAEFGGQTVAIGDPWPAGSLLALRRAVSARWRLASRPKGRGMEHLLLKAATTATTDQGEFEAVISTASIDRDGDIVEPLAIVKSFAKWVPLGKMMPLAYSHRDPATGRLSLSAISSRLRCEPKAMRSSPRAGSIRPPRGVSRRGGW